jgi:hypothetical protein
LARNLESDEKDLAAQGISKVDFVVCNLYPFQETVAKTGVTVPEAVEEIDIGTCTSDDLYEADRSRRRHATAGCGEELFPRHRFERPG